MKKKMPKLIALLLAVMMTAALLVGCGGSGSDNAKSTPEQPTAGDETGAKDETAKEPLVLNVGVGSTIDSMTPFRNAVAPPIYSRLLYENLALINGDKELKPWVAKSWTTADEGFSYDIELFDNVYDSAGNQITASDIVWYTEEAMTRALDPAFAKIDSIEQTGDYTFKVTFNSNMVGVLEGYMQKVYVVSKAAFEASADEFATSLVATGAYAVTKFTAGIGYTVEKRADYWQSEELIEPCVRPVTDIVNFKFITEASQMGIALETGEIDIAVDLDATTAIQYMGLDDFTVDVTSGAQTYQMFFSGVDSSPVANDQKLREAIIYAIDRDAIITALCSGYGEKAYDIAGPGYIGYNKSWESEDYFTYDVEKAKACLAESDYAGEELVILPCPYGILPKEAEMIVNYLSAVGIKAKLETVDMAYFSSIRLDGTKYDIMLHTIGGAYIADMWATRLDSNAYTTGDATGRHDEALNELLHKTWVATGYTEDNINEIHKYLIDNVVAVGMFTPNTFCAWNSSITFNNIVYDKMNYITVGASDIIRNK